jgi:dihydrofolate synthase / folylpolyglutamate synthase
MNSIGPVDSEAYKTAVDFLYDRINYERTTDQPYNQNNFRLSRMERLLVELDNPQQAAPVIHIAGSKGKGSVAWLTAECLRNSGYRTGLYTSPHLLKLEERFVIDARAVDESQLLRAVEAIRPAAMRIESQGHGHATFFELTTAIAWWLFRDQKVDVNVIEVGLGGRLDSTNVCWPTLSIITSISYDHQQQLGNTITEIAREKAGIIKPGVPVVSGATHPEAIAVISQVAKERGCKLRQLNVDFSVSSSGLDRVENSSNAQASYRRLLDYRPSATTWPQGLTRRELGLRLIGKHQLSNAAVVMAGLDILREQDWKISESAIHKGLAETQVPARIETVATQPTTIVDTAHNEASIAALIDSLDEHFAGKKRIVVFSASRDKKCVEMLELLMKSFQEIILTQFQINPRAQLAETLNSMADSLHQEQPRLLTSNYRVTEKPLDALKAAQESASPDDLIVITGSFFLAAELLPCFRK